MSFFEILLESSTEKEYKKKQACALLIVITTILLIISIIAFAICQVVAATTNNDSDDEKDTQEETVDLGETTAKQLSDTAIYSGNLLTLNSTARYKGDPDVVNLQQREDRPKKEDGTTNTYSVLKAVRDKYHATEATAMALNKMLGAFYEAKKDDNLFISGAYDTSEVDSQDAIFSSGEAVALSYFHDFANNNINDQRSIAGVDTYKWIYANAHKYGFIAVSANSNVFRYVGVTHATAAKLKGLTLDKYLNQLKNATPELPMRVDASGAYIAYYCPIANVTVPKNYSYEISGNNIDGVIVTVNVSKSVTNTED